METEAKVRRSSKFSSEVIERALGMVFDAEDRYAAQWAAIKSIVGRVARCPIGCL